MKPHWSLVTLYLSLVVLVGMCSYFVWTTSRLESGLEKRAETVLTHLDSTLSQTDAVVAETGTAVVGIQSSVKNVSSDLHAVSSGINQTFYLINKSCSSAPCGTLADVNRTLATFRGTAGTLEIAGRHEDQNLSHLDAQETQLFQDTHTALVGFVPLENEFDKAAYDLDDLVTSKDVSGTIHNFDVISGNFGSMTTDANTRFRAFLFPPPCHAFKCHLIQGYTFVKDASSLAEPAYWIQQMLTGAKP